MRSLRPLRIGVSASLVHAGSQPTLALGLPCLVMLESLAHWVMSRGDLAMLIPTTPGPEWRAPCRLRDLVDGLDGLVLQGGADVCPSHYGEEARRPEWQGDARRDEYEFALLKEVLAQGKPVLGICRGMQLLNVAFGGSLLQDIAEDRPSAVAHRNPEGRAIHSVRLSPGGRMAQLYGGTVGGLVVSVHHQAVKRPGRGMVVEAVSPQDGLVEAIRLDDGERFVWGLQWHPEIQPPGQRKYLDPGPILEAFRQAAIGRASLLMRRAG